VEFDLSTAPLVKSEAERIASRDSNRPPEECLAIEDRAARASCKPALPGVEPPWLSIF
jgi:hypothetical protein